MEKRKPYFVLSKQKLREQYKIIASLVDHVSYSLKTNNEVGKVLEETENCDFSVHSIAEADNIGDKSRLWFFPQGWDEGVIKELLSLGVKKFVVDNETDLQILIAYLDDYPEQINLLMRMKRKEHTIHTGKHFVFGMYTEQIKRWIPILRNKLWVNQLGIHFHRKTQNVSEWSLAYELKQSFPQDLLHKIDIVNIGGGLPIIYKNYHVTNIEEIKEKINECKKWLHNHNIKIYAEPGRFIAGPAVQLITQIINVYNNNIIVNASIFHGALDTFIANTRLLVRGELQKGTPYTIKGNTPDSRDIFRYRVYLDNPMKGDEIVFLNAGAYNFHTDFCLGDKLKTIIID